MLLETRNLDGKVNAMSHVVVQGCGTISSLGLQEQAKLRRLSNVVCRVDRGNLGLSFRVPEECEEVLRSLQGSFGWDRAVCCGVLAAQQAVERAGWWQGDSLDGNFQVGTCGILMGSSRGAASTYEAQMVRFLHEGPAAIDTRCSPHTTLGGFASAIADFLKWSGAGVDLSMTCSSGLMALAQAYGALKGGIGRRYLVGGAESPLTPFTFAQMKALGIYSDIDDEFPCRPLAENKNSTFVLGEAAGVLALESCALVDSSDIVILGCAVARDSAGSATGISPQGVGFQLSMEAALEQIAGHGLRAELVDLIIPHAPGTRKGDMAELEAIAAVFGGCDRRLYTHKWLVGHTLGASGLLSLELGILALRGSDFPSFPYQTRVAPYESGRNVPKLVLVNAAGFGGTIVTVILGRGEVLQSHAAASSNK
jgi:3-oxoacyl-[acyl-carrier-protein] synthase II